MLRPLMSICSCARGTRAIKQGLMLSNIIYSTVSALLFEIYKEESFDFGPALLFDCNIQLLFIVIP